MALRGRGWFALWLAVLLLVAGVVTARQTAALRLARDLAAVQTRGVTLDGQRAALERRVRAAESRAQLVPRAQRWLGLRLPADTEIILVPLAPGGREPR